MQTSQHAIADALMHALLDQMLRVGSGETANVRAASWGISGTASACCGAPITLSKRLAEVCYQCRQPCEARSWYAPHERHQQGDGFTTMIVRETRSQRTDLEQTQRLRESIRSARVERLILPRPRDVSDADWRGEHLFAWGLLLLSGSAEAARERAQGKFTPWTLRERVRYAREVVARRAIRRPYDVRAALDGFRLSNGNGRLCA